MNYWGWDSKYAHLADVNSFARIAITNACRQYFDELKQAENKIFLEWHYLRACNCKASEVSQFASDFIKLKKLRHSEISELDIYNIINYGYIMGKRAERQHRKEK